MNNLSQEKTDVVSVILENHDLLDAFSDSLKVEQDKDFSIALIPETSLGRLQKIKCYLWRKAKEIMKVISNKVQILAVLTEYNLKEEERKIQLALLKKD